MQFLEIKNQKQYQMSFDKKGETYVVFFHNISGKLTFEITNTDIKLYIFGLYTGKNTDVFHIETIQHHLAQRSLSDLFIKGVFEDSSKFIYQGLIRLEKAAQKSHAYQKNQNIILSPGVFVDSRPFLEILANDVFCTHGSTTGKLSQDEILYSQTRGLDKKTAEKMLVSGFIEEIYLKLRQIMPSADLSSYNK